MSPYISKLDTIEALKNYKIPVKGICKDDSKLYECFKYKQIFSDGEYKKILLILDRQLSEKEITIVRHVLSYHCVIF